MLSYIKRDLDMLIFFKSFISRPHKNIGYFFKLLKFVANLCINKLFQILKLDFSKLKNYKYYYLISISSRAKYLKWIYFSNSLLKTSKVNPNWHSNLPSLGWKPNNIEGTSRYADNLELASKNIKFKNNKISWIKIYNDPEDTMSLHRFGWLLKMLVDKENELDLYTAFKWIEDWLCSQKRLKNSISWESYSVSERIVNWLLFLCAAKPFIKIDNTRILNLQNELFDHLKYLAFNLEYRKDKTNNHIINNARALYIGGRLLGFEFAEKIAKLIITNETDKLIKNGILNEGSTHYQLLVTKNYLEIFWIAHKTKDEKLISWLKGRIKNMLDICNDFIIENNGQLEMPFIGDVSPDSNPDWLIGYPFNSSKTQFSGWSKLWGNFNEFDDLLINMININNNNELGSLKKNQWVRITNSSSTTFSIIKNSFIKSHAHQDDGSFYFMYKETPIIIDPGLKNYLKDDSISRYQLSANSHNVITINGCGVIPPRTSWMSRAIMGSLTKSSLGQYSINFKMNGFNCLGRSIVWDRTIDTNKDLLNVCDKINSRENDLIKIIYIFNNSLEYTKDDGGFIIKLEKEKLYFEIKPLDINNRKINNGRYKISDSYMSKKYGQTNKCKTITYSFNANGQVSVYSYLSKF